MKTLKNVLTSNVGLALSAFVIVGTIIYGFLSLERGTPNYKKWGEIQELKVQESFEKYESRRLTKAKEYFTQFDENKDGVIDSTEFYNNFLE